MRAFLQLVQALGVIEDGVLRFLPGTEAILPLPLLLFARGLARPSGETSALLVPVGADGTLPCIDWSGDVSVASWSLLGDPGCGGILTL